MQLDFPNPTVMAIAALIVAGFLWKVLSGRREAREAEATEPLASAAVQSLAGHEIARRFSSPDALASAAALLVRKRKIEAIKEIRAATGLGLKEAKDLADELEAVLRSLRGEAAFGG
jgi:ribosomal protein L7/L12